MQEPLRQRQERQGPLGKCGRMALLLLGAGGSRGGVSIAPADVLFAKPAASRATGWYADQ